MDIDGAERKQTWPLPWSHSWGRQRWASAALVLSDGLSNGGRRELGGVSLAELGHPGWFSTRVHVKRSKVGWGQGLSYMFLSQALQILGASLVEGHGLGVRQTGQGLRLLSQCCIPSVQLRVSPGIGWMDGWMDGWIGG